MSELKAQAIALIDAQEKFKETTLESLEEAVKKYKVALEASEPAKQEVLRIIQVLKDSCNEWSNSIFGELYEAVREDKTLLDKYWEVEDCYSDISDALRPVEMKYAYDSEELVDWNSSAC